MRAFIQYVTGITPALGCLTLGLGTLLHTAPTTDRRLCHHRNLGQGFLRAVFALCLLGAPMLLSGGAWAATYTVTTVADTEDPTDGHLSLREALLLANAHPGLDTITFAIDNGIFGPPATPFWLALGSLEVSLCL